MPYFSLESVESVARAELTQRYFSFTEKTAARWFESAASEMRLDRVPEEPSPAPPILFDVFLAHSSLDKIQVLGVYLMLTARGYRVYLDQICDPDLNPAHVTRRTARVLRYRMAQSQSVFVATSANTSRSQWVPWELGFMNGWNFKAAILPLVQSPAASFSGQEYFELYPEVRDRGSINPKPNDLELWDQGMSLGTWGRWLGLSGLF